MSDLPVAPTYVNVSCETPGCSQNGVQREIRLQVVAMGVIALPRMVCVHCSTDLNVTWPGRGETADV